MYSTCFVYLTIVYLVLSFGGLQSDTVVNVVKVQCDLRRRNAKQGKKHNEEATRTLG